MIQIFIPQQLLDGENVVTIWYRELGQAASEGGILGA